MIELIIALALGIAIGFGLSNKKESEPEQEKDFSYYKNLSESLMQDVRRLREQLKNERSRDV